MHQQSVPSSDLILLLIAGEDVYLLVRVETWPRCSTDTRLCKMSACSEPSPHFNCKDHTASLRVLYLTAKRVRSGRGSEAPRQVSVRLRI